MLKERGNFEEKSGSPDLQRLRAFLQMGANEYMSALFPLIKV